MKRGRKPIAGTYVVQSNCNFDVSPNVPFDSLESFLHKGGSVEETLVSHHTANLNFPEKEWDTLSRQR